MKCVRLINLLIVGVVFSTVAIGCGATKQVRYTSGPPNVAVSTESLNQESIAASSVASYSNDTQYVHVKMTQP
ncbi:hypothetical protein [Candidatus Nitronereus thalassa]|uniref:Uncharacterized protein n=1 Tax=Candidatus Nitronereus thalassa TaxID=3020898 RepID=A0ABU3KCC2_9BACT|nr:hypothetical protein [Candidatus Nitronereus thalassa]MDT7044077.1 hypothetical protein [Candidatus Nitronereus thalassa]